MEQKYWTLGDKITWICSEPNTHKGASLNWKALFEAFPVIDSLLAWKLGNGNQVCLREDSIMGCGENF